MLSAGAQCERRHILRRLAVFLGLVALTASAGAQQAQTPGAGNVPKITADLIFAGIRGNVIALDRSTGKIVWSTQLGGGDFVNVVLSREELYASTRGELFSIDVATGKIRWHNLLKGYGRGLMIITASGVFENQAAAIQRRQRQKEEQAVPAQPN